MLNILHFLLITVVAGNRVGNLVFEAIPLQKFQDEKGLECIQNVNNQNSVALVPDLRYGHVRRRLHRDSVKELSYSATGKYVASIDSKNILCLSAASKLKPVRLDGREKIIDVLSFRFVGNQALLAVVTSDFSLTLWDCDSGSIKYRISLLEKSEKVVDRQSDWVNAPTLQFNDDGSSLCFCNGGLIRLCNVLSGKIIGKTFWKNGSALFGFSNFGKQIFIMGFSYFEIWDSELKQRRYCSKDSKGYVSWDFSGRCFADHDGKSIRVWNGQQKGLTKVFSLDCLSPESFEISPDGTQLAIVDNEMFRVFDVASGKLVSLNNYGRIEKLGFYGFFSHKSSMLAALKHAKDDTWVSVIDPFTERTIWSKMSCEECDNIAFSTDGRFLAFGSQQLNIVELVTGNLIATIKIKKSEITAKKFLPNLGGMVLGMADGNCIVCDWTSHLQLNGTKSKAFAKLWEDLASNSAAKAYQAMKALKNYPEEAIALSRSKLKVSDPTDTPRIRELIAKLDDDNYFVREKASELLCHLGRSGKSFLECHNSAQMSAEQEARIEAIINKIKRQFPTKSELQIIRTIQLLEWINTSDSTQCLKQIAAGEVWSISTQEANMALARLKLRP